MKYLQYIFLLTIVSCNNQQGKSRDSDTSVSKLSATDSPIEKEMGNATYWKGTINGRTPVFIHYRLDSGLIVGEITYLNTKARQPITLLGTVDSDRNYRMLEFEETGNITGIIYGHPTSKTFSGSWFSPKTRKEFEMRLEQMDTVIPSKVLMPQLDEVFGHYHYQYSDAGAQGDFEIHRLPNSKVSFGITSVTDAPGRNVAQIEDDTIVLTQPKFVYSLPETNDCEFEVKFYKGFAYIRYTKGMCDGQFGMNATIDGIFLKTE